MRRARPVTTPPCDTSDSDDSDRPKAPRPRPPCIEHTLIHSDGYLDPDNYLDRSTLETGVPPLRRPMLLCVTTPQVDRSKVTKNAIHCSDHCSDADMDTDEEDYDLEEHQDYDSDTSESECTMEPTPSNLDIEMVMTDSSDEEWEDHTKANREITERVNLTSASDCDRSDTSGDINSEDDLSSPFDCDITDAFDDLEEFTEECVTGPSFNPYDYRWAEVHKIVKKLVIAQMNCALPYEEQPKELVKQIISVASVSISSLT
ncbi:hypothetical protein AAF712_013406 [Marasmius tenuissimus]|uniref:Uncharacterized protein n=1 Tax=Marasmius tenuissimus TaxID=585030 RepID=A0ABR2ZDT5_9AGAR